MSDCATPKIRFETPTALPLEAAFDGGRITSDGGLLWLAKADLQLGLCEAISEHIPGWKKRKGLHSLRSLVRQRIFQIVCGYEDQNDSNSLREDPLLKVVCGSLPESGAASGSRRMQLDTLRLHLMKIGGRVRELFTKVRLHLASGHPGERSWCALSLALGSVHE
jgi:hypothetical protein